MVGRARQVHGFAVRAEGGAWNVIAGSHFSQFVRIGRQNRTKLGVAIFARSRVDTGHGEVVNHPPLIPAALVVNDEQPRDVRKHVDESTGVVRIGRESRCGFQYDTYCADRRQSGRNISAIGAGDGQLHVVIDSWEDGRENIWLKTASIKKVIL